jgi:hypothetical protein
MKFIDKNTAILKDGTIVTFNDNGETIVFASKLWYKKTSGKYKHKTKHLAIKIWNEVNKLLADEN